MEPLLALLLTALVAAYCFGWIMALDALFKVRRPHAAVAWIISLLTIPFLALPFYVLVGSRRFKGYVHAFRTSHEEITDITRKVLTENEILRKAADDVHDRLQPLELIKTDPFTHFNDVELLIDGQTTFDRIFSIIEQARDYVLLQYYIVNDDDLGHRLAELLKRKTAEGVRVYLLYDEIGCYKTDEGYWTALREAGIQVKAFGTQRHTRRFQINFRNHRKMTIADGLVAVTGGQNVGDEYLGNEPEFGHWRDTSVCLRGPCVQYLQLVYLQDWYWAALSIPVWRWEAEKAAEPGMETLILDAGPADPHETCGMFFLHAINTARDRLWISSPYFVPDEAVVLALEMAVLRGVDVRILLPSKADHPLVYLSSYAFIKELDPKGVKFYRYTKGFVHQKALVMDNDLAAVGSANLDNRSFRLNFEVVCIVANKDFALRVAAMLENDFADSHRATAQDYHDRNPLFRTAVEVARLLSPLQ